MPERRARHGPIRRRKRGYMLMTDQSDTGNPTAGLDTDTVKLTVKPLLSRLATRKFNSSANAVRTPILSSVEPYLNEGVAAAAHNDGSLPARRHLLENLPRPIARQTATPSQQRSGRASRRAAGRRNRFEFQTQSSRGETLHAPAREGRRERGGRLRMWIPRGRRRECPKLSKSSQAAHTHRHGRLRELVLGEPLPGVP